MLSSISNNISSTYQFVDQNKSTNWQASLQQQVKTKPTHSETEKQDAKISSEEQQESQKLKARDQEVKAHEQAHLSAAGGLATSGASFSFQQGSNGISYAVAGEVSIDTSAVPGDSAATLQKADTIRRAALAPANPSSQDVKVASQASAMANKARAELFKENQDASEKIIGQNAVGHKISLSV